jgi:hypothetical protein
MKFTFVKFNCFLLLLICVGSCTVRTENTLNSQKFDREITIDGDLSDWPENLMTVTIVDREIDQGDNVRVLSDNKVVCKSLWNSQFLFMAFQVEDSKLIAHQTDNDHRRLYLDDMVEFLIDPNLDATELWLPDDLIYHINLLNTVKDDRGTITSDRDVAWDGKATHAIKMTGTLNDDSDTDQGYVLEVAVPWSEIGVDPEEGTKMGFNFANGDNDGKGRQLFDWMGAWPMRTPSQFGKLLLISRD